MYGTILVAYDQNYMIRLSIDSEGKDIHGQNFLTIQTMRRPRQNTCISLYSSYLSQLQNRKRNFHEWCSFACLSIFGRDLTLCQNSTDCTCSVKCTAPAPVKIIKLLLRWVYYYLQSLERLLLLELYYLWVIIWTQINIRYSHILYNKSCKSTFCI